MELKSKVVWATVAVLTISAMSAGIGLTYRKVGSLPFRAINDTLHREESPVTLDFLIPGGIYIDESMTIREVVDLRFGKPKNRLNLFVQKVSDIIPTKYLVLSSTILYVFWSFLFLIFFRTFTWMRYSTALCISFLLGALVYLFMPDMILGKKDDSVFLFWSIVILGIARWRFRRKRLQPAVETE
jgi:hypothetical protein